MLNVSKFNLGLFHLQKYKINMVKIAKKRKILIEEEKIPLLMKECDCSRSSVYNALAFATNSKLSKRIREAAASERFGGKEAVVPIVV